MTSCDLTGHFIDRSGQDHALRGCNHSSIQSIVNLAGVVESMNIKYAFALSVMLVLSACASGSSVVIGAVRPPTDPESVTLYIEPPAEYEIIGLVNASSDSGWTKQGDMDLAVEEIKKQAAKLGANGVLVTGTGENQESFVVGSTTSGTGSVYGGTVSSQTISGRAIFVTAE